MSPVRILAISDEVDVTLGPETLAQLRPNLIVSCGDLPFDYLEYVLTVANVPLVYVPGNHDPDIGPWTRRPVVTGAMPLRFDAPDPDPLGPGGGINVDRRIEDVAGIRVAGLGGSIRYTEGPNQYTQARMRWRARRLALRCRLRRPLRKPRVDVLITHSPPFRVGDADDPAHVGFTAFHALVRVLAPRLLLHGHIHPYGRVAPDRMMGDTVVVNAVGSRLVEVETRP